ncbi:MAG: TonB-dependent receptor [Gemmatimonadetes bacterium]|nr:TonB-dependent receptor [Gemmatimonadota bacterium]
MADTIEARRPRPVDGPLKLFVLLVSMGVAGVSNLAAQSSGTIQGTIRSIEDGEALASVQVAVEGTDRIALTGPEGRYLLDDVPAGERTVRIEGIFRAEPQLVRVIAGETVTVDFVVEDVLFSLAPIEVKATRAYRQDATTVGTKSPAQLLDIPGSVQVLSRKFIEDRGATRFEELYRNVSSLVDHPYSEVVLRGFQQREILFNGVRGNPYGSLDGGEDTGFSTSVGRLTNIERVEVLKGPVSALYGSAQPGGVINYVTKKPLDVFEARASIFGGSFEQRGGNAEITGPIDQDRRFLYRAAAFFEEKNSFRNNAGFRDLHLVGGLTWRASEATRLDVEAERIDQDLTGHRLRGIPVSADGTMLTDRSWTATEPTDFTRLDATVFQAALNHAFDDGFSVDATVRALGYDRSENYHEPRGLLEDERTMQREFRDQFRSNDDWSATLNLNRRLDLGGAGEHSLLLGVETATQDWRFRFARARQSGNDGPVPDLDLFSPVYGVADPSTYGLTPESFSEQSVRSRRTGVYVQDQAFVTPSLVLTGGARVDWYDDEGEVLEEAGTSSVTAFTGRFGVVVKPSEVVSLYGNFANGFSRPDFVHQVPSANGPFDPGRSWQLEGGIKADLLGRRLMVTAAGYTITRTNVLRPDPNFGPNGDNFSAVFATGEVRSRGLELDAVGSIGDRIAVSANYALLVSRIVRDDDAPDNVGEPWPNAPRHSAGLTGRFAVGSGGIGVSTQFVGERQQTFAGIVAPSYAVVDLSGDLRLTDRFDLRVSLNNVFDTTYAVSSLFASRAGNIPGDPRTLRVELATASTWWAR